MRIVLLIASIGYVLLLLLGFALFKTAAQADRRSARATEAPATRPTDSAA